jgi:hypothetical protein
VLFTVATRWPARAWEKIERCRNYHAGRTVDLLQKLIVHQHAACLGGK